MEASVRRLARAVEDGSWQVTGAPLFASEVEYAGPTRRFCGYDGYAAGPGGLLPGLGAGRTGGRVEGLRMLSLMEAEIRWSVRPGDGGGGGGQEPGSAPAPLRADAVAGPGIGAAPGRVRVRSEFRLNPITGRVEAHRDSWDLSSLAPPERAFVAGRQAFWGACAGLAEAARASAELVGGLLGDGGDDGGDIFVDPNDPGRWVQQEDSVFKDGVFFALLVSILWVFARALVEIENLNF